MKGRQLFILPFSLTILSAVVTALVILINDATSHQIIQRMTQAKEMIQQEVLPKADMFLDESMTVNGEMINYSVAKNGVGFLFTPSVKGYGGTMDLMVGVSVTGEVAGVRILSHNETPGLGQRAEEAIFLKQYEEAMGKFLVTKGPKAEADEIEAITGATITSVAVTEAVNDAMRQYELLVGGEKK